MKIWIVIGGCVVLIGALMVPMFFGPTDSQLVQEALKESVKASREGRPGGVMDYLSNSLKFNEDAQGNRQEIASYVRRARPEIVIHNTAATFDHDRATVISPVDVSLSLGPISQPMHLDRVEITLAKESGTRFLIFPAPKWRIIDIKTPDADISQFAE